MRILKSRSDQEVSSTGFALFIAGLILAGFIGGAMRTLLSSDQIQNRILTAVQAALPALQVKMDPANVTLARGIWPGLSISIPKLHLIKPEACGETYGTVELEDINLPLDIFPLLRSRVHWDVVTVSKLSLIYSKKPCPPSKPQASKESPSPPPNKPPEETGLMASADSVREHIAKAFAIARQLRDHLHGVQVKRVEVASSEDPSWLVAIADFDMRVGGVLTTSAKLHFEKTLVPGKIEHEATFKAEINPQQLKWEVRSPLKEGLIHWSGVANQANDSLDQRLMIRQIPLKDVLLEIQTWSGLTKGGSPKFIWLSCDLGQSGALSQFKTIPLEISDCKIDGEGEQIRAVPGQQVWPWERTPLHQPLRFQVSELSLQTLLDLLGNPVFRL